MPKPLTPALLRNLKLPTAGQVEIADATCVGLRLRLSVKSATWLLGCRDPQGRARRFVLGRFADLGLAQARVAARGLRERVRDGLDPVAAARARRAAGPSDGGQTTLRDILDVYGQLVGGYRRSWPRARRLIEHVFENVQARRAIELTAPELQVAVDKHKSRASAGAAVRYLKPLLKWAARRGLMASGIAEGLEQPEGAQGKRDRVLARTEIHAILDVLDAVGGYGDVIRWLFLTAARLNEACNARWSHIDRVSGLWAIPVTKSGKPHVVPLPAPGAGYVARAGAWRR